MCSSKDKSNGNGGCRRMQTITPEEPGKSGEVNSFHSEIKGGDYESGSALQTGSKSRSRSRSGSESKQHSLVLPEALKKECDVSKETEHSLRSTRMLELEISQTVRDMEDSKPSDEETKKLISLLNRSLSAISHWSLQAQLSHWENKGQNDERFAVEKNLVKKEAEYFKNKFLESEKNQQEQQRVQHTDVSLNSSPLKACSSPSPSVSSPKSALLSPRRVTKQKKSSHQPTPMLKLVENTKPHPRLKRNLTDQSNQEMIRVFHLEKRG